MKVNMFEGARRIAFAIGVVWTAGCLAYAALTEPHVSLTYAVESYGAKPVPAERCASRDASKYTTFEAPEGKEISVTLCFIAERADDGSYLIPYRQVASASNPEAASIYAARTEALRRGAHADAAKLTEFLFKLPVNPSEPQTVWMAGEYDSNVRRYMDDVAAGFKLQSSDLRRWEEAKGQTLWEQWKQALQVLFGGLALGWLFIAVLGWVVRGFLGIPRGRDSRPEA